jgi:MFS family permease
LLWCGQLVSLVGRQITVVAVPFQIFQITHSPLAVGMLGLFQVVPLIGCSLVAGAVADAVDRRRLLLLTNVVLAALSGVLAVAAHLGAPPLFFIYAVATLAAAVSAFDQPARSATVPNLVQRSQLAAAVALTFGMFQAGTIAGPAIGGVVIARFGLTTAYLVDVVTFAAAILGVFLISPQPRSGAAGESALAAIRGGLTFARRQPAILGGFAADLCAMVFGAPRALFPVLAATTFNTGPSGLGLLYSAPGAGALLAAIVATGWVGGMRRQGLAIIVSVAVWGAAIVGFGFASSLWIALLLLAVAGAADAISAVCRATMMQTLTPDEYRGRMSATFSMVVVGGSYLGDIEAGSVAAVFTPRISVISGGGLCLASIAVIAALFPSLRNYRASAVDHSGVITAAAFGEQVPGATTKG